MNTFNRHKRSLRKISRAALCLLFTAVPAVNAQSETRGVSALAPFDVVPIIEQSRIYAGGGTDCAAGNSIFGIMRPHGEGAGQRLFRWSPTRGLEIRQEAIPSAYLDGPACSQNGRLVFAATPEYGVVEHLMSWERTGALRDLTQEYGLPEQQQPYPTGLNDDGILTIANVPGLNLLNVNSGEVGSLSVQLPDTREVLRSVSANGTISVESIPLIAGPVEAGVLRRNRDGYDYIPFPRQGIVSAEADCSLQSQINSDETMLISCYTREQGLVQFAWNPDRGILLSYTAGAHTLGSLNRRGEFLVLARDEDGYPILSDSHLTANPTQLSDQTRLLSPQRFPAGSSWDVTELLGATESGLISALATHDGVSYLVALMPRVCTGDFNYDNAVNSFDLSNLLSAFGKAVLAGDPHDLNRDGAVNTLDLLILLNRFGKSCA